MTVPADSTAGRWTLLRHWLSRKWESRPLVGMRTESASDRMVRRLALAVGCAGMIAAAHDMPGMLRLESVVGDWATAASIAAFALFPLLAVTAIAASIRVVRATARATAVVYLAAAALVSTSFDQVVLPESLATWMFRVFSVGVLAASVAWRSSLAIAYMLCGNVVLAFGNLSVVADPSAVWFLGVLFRSIGLCALFLWCSIYAQAGAAAVDREAAAAGARAARVAGAAARDREQARFAALIHDAVLSTLLDASRAGAESPVLREQAARTLEQLAALRRGTGGSERFDAQAVGVFLTAAVREVDPDLTVEVSHGPGSETLRMPVDAAGTLTAAAIEALRNSLRHASAGGRDVRRGIALAVNGAGVRVRMCDDGAGFDPNKVPIDRLGLTVSILGRMRSVPGGAAEIVSRPGHGTTVVLHWADGREQTDPGVLFDPLDDAACSGDPRRELPAVGDLRGLGDLPELESADPVNDRSPWGPVCEPGMGAPTAPPVSAGQREPSVEGGV